MVEEPTNYPRLIHVAPKNLGKLCMQVELVKTLESNFQESEVSKTLVRHLRTALGSCTSVHCILCISY